MSELGNDKPSATSFQNIVKHIASNYFTVKWNLSEPGWHYNYVMNETVYRFLANVKLLM